MSLFPAILLGAFLCCALMFGLWKVQERTQNAGIVDFGWSACMALLAVHSMLVGEGDDYRRILVGSLGGIWGTRLALHLFYDRVLDKPEDGRYLRLRAHWGSRANSNFLWFFQAQALLAVVLGLPFFLGAQAGQIGLRALLGAWLWLIAIVGETVADRQLANWRKDPNNKGRTCRSGLWRYSRHPNYFCEWLIWCSFAIVALDAPHGYIGLIAPAIMLYLILYVSGVPYNEAQALASRGDDYREYQRTTNRFVPWLPRE